MNFGQSIKSCFNKYATFQGRASRSEYWFWHLFTIIGSICTLIADTAITGSVNFAPFDLIFFIITLLPSLSVSVRRLHDINRSGWWLLIMLNVIGVLLLTYWACIAGDQERNKFGENPLLEK